MLGVPDPLYIAARHVLLDALDALSPHLESIVLVGAQAVYVHAGEADIAVAPFTQDGDLAIDPRSLGNAPLIEQCLRKSDFVRKPDAVGIWQRSIEVNGAAKLVDVDLLVPDSLAGPGRRAARLASHGADIARRAAGLEASLIDKDVHDISALEPSDVRRHRVAVAGPAALIVAKAHKIKERTDNEDRVRDKDALDVYRLLQSIPTPELARRIGILRSNSVSRQATDQAVSYLPELFGKPQSAGTMMAVRAAGVLVPSTTMAASLVALTEEFLSTL